MPSDWRRYRPATRAARASRMSSSNRHCNGYCKDMEKLQHAHMFTRSPLVEPRDGGLDFKLLDLDTNRFSPAEWPAGWGGMRDRLAARQPGPGPFPFTARDSNLIDLPRFGPTDHGFREKE